MVGDGGREDAAQGALGSFGPWQAKVFFFTAILKFPAAWTLLGLIFMGPQVKYHCTGYPNSTCTIPDGQTCTNWTYDRSVFLETITTEWDLVCSRSQLVNVAQMTFMIGIMFGTILFSIASDRYGRKVPLIVTGIIQLVAGVLVAFVPWYWAFVTLRFLQAIAVGGSMTISFVLCMEVLNGKWRTIMATLTHIPFNLGTVIMAAIAYYTRHWRQFELAISLPVGIVLFYWWLIPESPRWLMAVGKDKEALAVLQSAAKRNKNAIPEKLPEIIRKQEYEDNTSKPTLVDLFSLPNMRKKTLIVWFNWANVGLCFFGLEQYLSQVGHDIFVSVAISGVCIIPGVVASIYTMDKLGRKWTLFVAQLVAAISCLIIILIPESLGNVHWYRVGFATVGVTGTAVGFTTLYLYSTELFPTVVRNTGLGSGSMCARIGSMVAPFVATLDTTSPSLPPTIFGATNVIAALLCLLLPETVNRVLPVTLEDGENFEKLAKCKKGVENKGYVGNPNA